MSANVRPAGDLDELRRIVPTEQIEPHQDGSDHTGGSFAVEPATREELVDLMRWAKQKNAVVFTRHARRTDADRCGSRLRIYLRGQRMARVQDVDIVSGTVTVQSGITMAELHRILGERGFTTGFASRSWKDESLGAVVAACLDAHWGPPYGMMEDQVVAIGGVLPDGTPVQSRAVPRRAVGPDFDRLFLGSRGRFGVIHTVTLRIYPSSARVLLTYGARTIEEGLIAMRECYRRGLEARCVEVITAAPDRSWGRKRVGLSDKWPVLVLVEPWGRHSAASRVMFEESLGSLLKALEPPVGWNIHEGLLPPHREWKSPVCAVPWEELEGLARRLGTGTPPGLWMVRMSRHGAWVSIAEGVKGPHAKQVRDVLKSKQSSSESPFARISRDIKERLDPSGILNPLWE